MKFSFKMKNLDRMDILKYLVLVIVLITIISCNKSEVDENTFNKFTGNWEITRLGSEIVLKPNGTIVGFVRGNGHWYVKTEDSKLILTIQKKFIYKLLDSEPFAPDAKFQVDFNNKDKMEWKNKETSLELNRLK